VSTEQDKPSDTIYRPHRAYEVERRIAARDEGTAVLFRSKSVQVATQQAATELQAHTETPRMEAEILMELVLHSSRARLLAHPERLLSANQLWWYTELTHRRALGHPLPYVTGRAEFYGLTFDVTPEVLIPRPETEALVDLALERNPSSVVDVGTGSGCIAISLALHLTNAQITAIDVSAAAVAVAQSNAERHGVGDRVELMVGDILSPRPGPAEMIISNPPYVLTSEIPALPVSIRDHEPLIALDGGVDGLMVIRRLMNQAPAVLESGGCLLIEISPSQRDSASHLARTVFPDAHIRIHPDLAGLDRVLEIQT